jgi:hypothetical protein
MHRSLAFRYYAYARYVADRLLDIADRRDVGHQPITGLPGWGEAFMP